MAKLFIFRQLPQRTSLKLNMMASTQTLAKACTASLTLLITRSISIPNLKLAMPAACMPASINLTRRQHSQLAPLPQSIGKLSRTTESNPPRMSTQIASSFNLRSLRLFRHMSLRSLLAHICQFMTSTRARRQFRLASMPVNHSLNMSMLRTSSK